MSRPPTAMLAKAGRDAGVARLRRALAGQRRRRRARSRGAGRTPSPLHNNCSGKHAGFVCLACARAGIDPAGYDQADAPGPARRQGGDRGRDGRGARRGRLRDRRLLDSDLRDPAARAGARLCAPGDGRRGCRAQRAAGGGADFRRGRGEPGDGRRRGPVRHRGDAPVRRARLRQDRAPRASGAPPCRSLASARGQGRRRRDARGAGR